MRSRSGTPAVFGATGIAAAALAAFVPAQVQWSLVGPTPSNLGGAVHDSGRDRLVGCFVGANGWEIWEFDGMAWLRMLAAQTPVLPGPMSYDPLRQRVILYDYHQATWEWDGVNWSLGNAGTPGIECVFYHGGRGRTMAFGGVGANGLPGNDLMEWDGTNWSIVPSPNALLRRGFYAGSTITYGGFTYDQRRDRIVVFGEWYTGYPWSHPNPAAKTWEWDALNGWVQRPAGGLAEEYMTTVFDERRGRLVTVSREVGIAPPVHVSEWDGVGQWTVRNVAGPTASGVPGSTWDGGRGRILTFFTDASFWALSSILPARYDLHGAGCPGVLGTPTLRPSEPWTLPWLGGTLSVDLAGLPVPVALLAMGFSDQSYGGFALPYGLGPLGMPGCFVRAEPLASVLITGSGGIARFQMTVPYLQHVLGVRFFQQALVLSPGSNPMGLVLSDSARGEVGWLQ